MKVKWINNKEILNYAGVNLGIFIIQRINNVTDRAAAFC